MKTTIKEVFESDNWIITTIKQGYNKRVRIDAKTCNHVADGLNIFSEWCTEKYANKLSIENYGKNINDLRGYRY